MDTAHLADGLLAASTALAGLILVFIGNAVSGYDAYSAAQQHAVKGKYQRRGWLGFVGFSAALVSALLALANNWLPTPCIVYFSAGLLVLSLVCVWFAALIEVREIK